jgi:hypothetical protein
LTKKGFFIFGEKGVEKIKYGNGESDNWEIATLLIKNKDSSEIIKMELKNK